jgi:ATP-dependent Clp endopeptidase proteolytic subunit ClpP
MSDDTYHKFKKDDVDQFMENDIYLPTRTIYMGSMQSDWDGYEAGVDYAMAEQMIKTLHILDNQDAESRKGNKPITIIMNNPGGEVYHGLAIYDAIRNCKNHVTIKVYGHAMSMGSWILQAADHRIMTENSRIMIHYGYDGTNCHSKTFQKYAVEGEKVNELMENVFLEKIESKKITQYEYLNLIGKTLEAEKLKAGSKRKLIDLDRDKLEKMLNFDTFIDAKMAKKMNLIDEIENAKDDDDD